MIVPQPPARNASKSDRLGLKLIYQAVTNLRVEPTPQKQHDDVNGAPCGVQPAFRLSFENVTEEAPVVRSGQSVHDYLERNMLCMGFPLYVDWLAIIHKPTSHAFSVGETLAEMLRIPDAVKALESGFECWKLLLHLLAACFPSGVTFKNSDKIFDVTPCRFTVALRDGGTPVTYPLCGMYRDGGPCFTGCQVICGDDGQDQACRNLNARLEHMFCTGVFWYVYWHEKTHRLKIKKKHREMLKIVLNGWRIMFRIMSKCFPLGCSFCDYAGQTYELGPWVVRVTSPRGDWQVYSF
ncbi:MAG: hypothetical protein H0Z39_11715 [Peptococcaceae bacterium]|nr:hypothetical protein [Peptococcaceae bacterium]